MKLKSEGLCPFCNKTLTQGRMSRHLQNHLDKSGVDPSKEPGNLFLLLKVHSYDHFLFLLVEVNRKLEDLDQYLRDIWLECCGHLSRFGGWGEEEWPMDYDIGEVFMPDTKMAYYYDFGTTTELTIKVDGAYFLSDKPGIYLLSRNNPFPYQCEMCKKKLASKICPYHGYGEPYLFCNKCYEKHTKTCEDAGEYMWLPVVNSPRMGECGYEGGTIDLERDGVAKI